MSSGVWNGYYRPYTSDNEDSGTESDSETASSDDSIARGLDDPRYAIIRAAGPPLNTVNEQLYYQTGNAMMGSAYNDADAWNPPANPTAHDKTFGKFTPATQAPLVSLFAFSSSNRDKQTYPYSTFFTIKTPRTYKNVTQIKFVNINFPYFLNTIADASSLYIEIATYVSSNTNLPFQSCYSCLGNVGTRGVTTAIEGGSYSEVGRMNPAAPSKPLVHTFTLRPGSYDGPGLCAEMEVQTNLTPPLAIISYGEHRQRFMATKTLDHLFNEGGKWYYHNTKKTYIQNPTKAVIRDDFFPHINVTDPSERETFVAYFLPVLKLSLNTSYDYAFLNLADTTLDEVKHRVQQTFEGLSSPYYYSLCYANLQFLRSIRPIHTFEYYPVNNYDWTYNPATQKILISHTNLHPALTKDIQSHNQQHQRQELAALGYTPGQFGALQAKAATTSAVVADLHEQVQKALVEVGVPYGAYSAGDLINSNLPLQRAAQRGPLTDDDLFALTEDKGLRAATADSITITSLLQDSTPLNHRSVLKRAGTNSCPTFHGVPVACDDFPSLYSTFVNYYSTNTALVKDVTTVQQNTVVATSNYVNTTYSRTLPKTILSDNAYMNNLGTGGLQLYASKTIHYASTPLDSDERDIMTERVTNQGNPCCGFMNAALNNFYGCLPSEYLINSAFYKLGFGIADILRFYSTNALSVSPATHNLYVQLNIEQSLNFMDIASDENHALSNQSSGQCNMVFGKLLTLGSSPGAFTQTIVQVPATFTSSPLASIDRFSFTFFLDTMVPLNKLYPFQISGTDWDAIIEIDENVAVLPPSTT
jgi:hypothetical protein